jgi:acyl-CoA thioesterase YciA
VGGDGVGARQRPGVGKGSHRVRILPMSEQQDLPVALPTDKDLVLRVIPLPADVNANGDIFGGWVMAQVDLAGSVLPARLAQGRIATVAVNQFVFKQPVRIGDLCSFYAEITRVGNTSITVNVEVYAQRLRPVEQIVKVTEATLTYVATDANGKPRSLPR